MFLSPRTRRGGKRKPRKTRKGKTKLGQKDKGQKNKGRRIFIISYSLTVGAGGTLIFDPSYSFSSIIATPVSMAVSPVPEPSTLTLLFAGLVVGWGVWRRGRKGLGIEGEEFALKTDDPTQMSTILKSTASCHCTCPETEGCCMLRPSWPPVGTERLIATPLVSLMTATGQSARKDSSRRREN